jgi:hypothetical protein
MLELRRYQQKSWRRQLDAPQEETLEVGESLTNAVTQQDKEFFSRGTPRSSLEGKT